MSDASAIIDINANAKKRILLGVSGSIAAYKAADLIRRFQDINYEVKPIMTTGATKFITPLTLNTLSGHACVTDMWQEGESIDHIAMAQWADAYVIAPASANTIGKCANGLASCMVSTTFLCAEAIPTFVAPAMNPRMWLHPITQRNMQQLGDLVRLIPPIKKTLACGETGTGGMEEPVNIVSAVQKILEPTP